MSHLTLHTHAILLYPDTILPFIRRVSIVGRKLIDSGVWRTDVRFSCNGRKTRCKGNSVPRTLRHICTKELR